MPMPAAHRSNTSPVLSHACLSSLCSAVSGSGEIAVRRSDAPGMSIGAT